MRYCGSCGAEIKDTAKFCPSCGAKCIDESNTVNKVKQEETSKRKHSKSTLLIVAVALLAIIIVGVILFIRYNSPEQQTMRAINDRDYDTAFDIITNNVSVMHNEEIITALEIRLSEIQKQYRNDEIEFTAAENELSEIEVLSVPEIDAAIADAREYIQILNQSHKNFALAESAYSNGDFLSARDYYSLVIEEDLYYQAAQDAMIAAVDSYRSAALEDAAECAADEAYDEAIVVLENALVFIPSDSTITQKIEEYQIAWDNLIETVWVKTKVVYYNELQTEEVPNSYREYSYDEHGRLITEEYFYVNYSWSSSNGFSHYEEIVEEVKFSYEGEALENICFYINNSLICEGKQTNTPENGIVLDDHYYSGNDRYDVQRVYNVKGMLLENTLEKNGELIFSYIYTYDDDGNILTETQKFGDGYGFRYDYVYNSSGCLERIDERNENDDSRGYSICQYDTTGRLVKKERWDSQDILSNYTEYLYAQEGNVKQAVTYSASTYNYGDVTYSETYTYEQIDIRPVR